MILSERTFLYAIGSEDGPVKVGITQNLQSRLRALQNGSSKKLDLIFVYSVIDRETAMYLERWFHEAHDCDRLEGEWFNIPADHAFERLENLVDLNYSMPTMDYMQKKIDAARKEAL